MGGIRQTGRGIVGDISLIGHHLGLELRVLLEGLVEVIAVLLNHLVETENLSGFDNAVQTAGNTVDVVNDVVQVVGGNHDVQGLRGAGGAGGVVIFHMNAGNLLIILKTEVFRKVGKCKSRLAVHGDKAGQSDWLIGQG